MSLEDKFYPEDGTALTAFDNRMIKLCGKVGEAYQWVTGRPYVDLIKACYTSVSVSGVVGMTTNPFTAVNLLTGYLLKRGICCESPLEEQIRLEACGFGAWERKAGRLLFAALTPVLAYFCVYNFLGGEDRNVSYSNIASGTSNMLFAPFVLGVYLEKAHIPKPPEKHVFARAYDKIKELLEPRPALQPVPVPISYEALHVA